MASAGDRTAFLLEEPKRLRVAELCSQQPRSDGELAQLLDVAIGALSAPKTMRGKRWGALVPAGKGGPRGAQLYSLDPSWRPAVKAAREQLDLQVPHAVSNVLATSDLLLVRLNSLKDACRSLSDPWPEIRWAAPVQGEGMGLMLCVSRLDQARSVTRVITRLSDEGVEVGRLSIDEPLSAADLAAWAQQVLTDGGSPLLPE